jgi:hypothetical protein
MVPLIAVARSANGMSGEIFDRHRLAAVANESPAVRCELKADDRI